MADEWKTEGDKRVAQTRTVVGFEARVLAIVADIDLGMDCWLEFSRDEDFTPDKWYLQIGCRRVDAITGNIGIGYGGRGYITEESTDSQIVQTAFGLYRGYWEHEARETFQWRKRRVFGPHISTEALWEVARRVDVRSAQHAGERP